MKKKRKKERTYTYEEYIELFAPECKKPEISDEERFEIAFREEWWRLCQRATTETNSCH